MKTRAITINVNVEAARIFETVSVEQQHKLEALLSLKLIQATSTEKTLDDIMGEISDKAEARGLTPEILESLLHE
jgi:hypothetical protein